MDKSDSERLTSTVGTRKGNCRVITITDNIPEHFEPLISIAKSSYEFYAYIYHDKDDGVDKHIHLLCIDKGGTSFKAHCERFSSVVPANFVLKVKSPRAMARYLIHKDNPEKFQYDPASVVTNQKDRYYNFLHDRSSDVVEEFRDFSRLVSGEISIFDYLEKYRSEFSTMPFYQKQALFHKIITSVGFPSSSPKYLDSHRCDNFIK